MEENSKLTPEQLAQLETWQPSCNARAIERDPVRKRALISRLSKIEGQIRGVKKMLENDAYDPNIIIQGSAAESAMRSFNRELLHDHIHTSVVDDIKDDREGTLDDLDMLLRLMLK